MTTIDDNENVLLIAMNESIIEFYFRSLALCRICFAYSNELESENSAEVSLPTISISL